MNRYLATMCELRPHEIEAERIIRRDRRRSAIKAVIEAVIGAPILIGFVVLVMFA